MLTGKRKKFIKAIHDGLDSLGIADILNFAWDTKRNIGVDFIYDQVMKRSVFYFPQGKEENRTIDLDRFLSTAALLLSRDGYKTILGMASNPYGQESRYYASLGLNVTERLPSSAEMFLGSQFHLTPIEEQDALDERKNFSASQVFVTDEKENVAECGRIFRGPKGNFEFVFGSKEESLFIQKGFLSSGYVVRDHFGNRLMSIGRRGKDVVISKNITKYSVEKTDMDFSYVWGHVSSERSKSTSICYVRKEGVKDPLVIFQAFRVAGLPYVKECRCASLVVIDGVDEALPLALPMLYSLFL